jgi:hypothetical protein
MLVDIVHLWPTPVSVGGLQLIDSFIVNELVIIFNVNITMLLCFLRGSSLDGESWADVV